ncbi:MAG: NYN domain-containing protein [Candidatus Omnitrophica bacterium]|nr:NYN domain-containing protein [Candidatus Omnitrophota bacterium]
MPENVIFYIDGFNLYHAINDHKNLAKEPDYKKYKWLDLMALCKMYLQQEQILKDVYYFTALATWNERKVNKHQVYIRALKSAGTKIIYGRFQGKDRECKNCHAMFTAHEEKLTDVNIATRLLLDAQKNRFDRAIIISGDNDLAPAIHAAKELYPTKQIGVIVPINRMPTRNLKTAAHFHHRMTEQHLKSAQLPDEIKVGESVIRKPDAWKLISTSS